MVRPPCFTFNPPRAAAATRSDVHVEVGRFYCPYVRTYYINTQLKKCGVELQPGIIYIKLGRPYLSTVMWWVMLCEVFAHVLASWFLLFKKVSFHTVFHFFKTHIHCLETFFLIVVSIIPSAAELSVFIGVSVWGKLIFLIVMRRGTAVFPL